jgi:hypothetical protein
VYDRQGFSAWVAYNKYQKKCDNFKISPWQLSHLMLYCIIYEKTSKVLDCIV